MDPLIMMALGAFAVTQPLLSDFRTGAGYFVAQRNEPSEIVLLVVVLTIVPGLLANLIVWAADGFSEKVRARTQAVLVGLFVALITHTTLVRLTSAHWAVLMTASLTIGILASLTHNGSTWWRTFLTYLIPAPLLFALFFLLTPPVSGLVFPPDLTAVDANVESQAPVVFVVLDEFPVVTLLDNEGEIDASRYPNFSLLASMSTWYKYTASAHDNTLWAVPGLLSGQTPDNSLLPTAANYPGNLFTLLARSHELHVIEPFTHLCPTDMCNPSGSTTFEERFRSLMIDSVRIYTMMLAPDSASAASVSDPFNEFLEGAADRVSQELVTDQVGRFAAFLEGISSSGPKLHFVHLFLPHAPFRYYPSGSQYNNGEELDGMESEVWVEPTLARQALQRHLLQLQTVDRMIGDLLARLDGEGVLDEAVLVVAADHGVSFKPAIPRRVIVDENAYDVGMVPLFIKAPHQNRGVIDVVPSRTIDVLPTVAAHLGLELPWIHDGQSLLRDPRESPPLLVQTKGGNEVALDDVEQGVRNATAYVESVFGNAGGSLDLYSLGDYDSLIGSAASDLAGDSSGLHAQVDEAWRLAHVAPYTDFVPGFIHGHLEGDVADGLQVAVALNGEVRTIVPTYAVETNTARFTAIIPDFAFSSGFNELDLFTVSGPVEAPVIETIDLDGHIGFEMEKAPTGRVTRLVDTEGGSWPIVEGSAVIGSVDDASWHDSGLPGSSPKDLHLHGWAVDEDRMKPVERVVFFVSGVFAGSTSLDLERQDIAEGYESSDVLVSGFLGRLAHFIPVSDNVAVRVFALSEGRAEELPIADSALSAISAG